jgi:hypothetical protein
MGLYVRVMWGLSHYNQDMCCRDIGACLMRNRYTQRPTQYIGDVYRLFSTHLRVDRLVCAISLSILDFQRIKKERRKKSPSRRIICCCHINGLLLLLSFSPPNFSFFVLGPFFYEIPACSWISRPYRAAAAVSSVIITGLHLIIMWGKKRRAGPPPAFAYSRRDF